MAVIALQGNCQIDQMQTDAMAGTDLQAMQAPFLKGGGNAHIFLFMHSAPLVGRC